MKELESTAKDGTDPIKPLYLDGERIYNEEDIDQLNQFGTDNSAYSDNSLEGFDPEFQGAQNTNFNELNQNISATGQDEGWSRAGRALGAGALEGAVGAFAPITDLVGGLVGAFGFEDLGNSIKAIDTELKESIGNAYKINEHVLGEDSSFLDEFLRASTFKSTVSSAVEFGLIGIGSGAVVGGIGKVAASYGAKISSINGLGALGRATRKTGEFIMGDLKLFSKAENAVGKFVHDNVSSSTFSRSIMSNTIEGTVMAEETRRDMYNSYRHILDNSNTSEELRLSIEEGITTAGFNMQLYNTTMIVSDLIGFQAIDRLTGRVARNNVKESMFKSGLGFMFKDMGLVRTSEGIEEVLQNVIQSTSKYSASIDIEERYGKLDDKNKVPGVEGIDPYGIFAPENTLLHSTNPGEASKLAFNKAKGLSEFLWDQATSRQALIEGASGMFGGGVQWMITGAPSYFAQRATAQGRANIAARKAAEEKFINTDAGYTFEHFMKENIIDDIKLDALIDELQTARGSNTFTSNAIREEVETFAIEKLAIAAIQNGHGAALLEYAEEKQDEISTAVKRGDLTSKEGKEYTRRLNRLGNVTRKLHNTAQHVNSAQLLELESQILATVAGINIHRLTLGRNSLEAPTLEAADAGPIPKAGPNFDEQFEEATVEDTEVEPVVEDETTEAEVIGGDKVKPEIVERPVGQIDAEEDEDKSEVVKDLEDKEESKDQTVNTDEVKDIVGDEKIDEKEAREATENEKDKKRREKAKSDQGTTNTQQSLDELLKKLARLKAEEKDLRSTRRVAEGYKNAELIAKLSKSLGKVRHTNNRSKIASDITYYENFVADSKNNLDSGQKKIYRDHIKSLEEYLARLKSTGQDSTDSTKSGSTSKKAETKKTEEEKATAEKKPLPPEVEETTEDEVDDIMDMFGKKSPATVELKEAFDVLEQHHIQEPIPKASNASPEFEATQPFDEDAEVKINDVEYHKAFMKIVNLIEGFRDLSPNGNTLPSLKDSIDIVGKIIGDRDVAARHVRAVYAHITQTPVQDVKEDRYHEPEKDPEEVLNTFSSEVETEETYIPTVKSYLESSEGIAWNVDAIFDFEQIKEKLGVLIRPMSVEEWKATAFIVTIGREVDYSDGTIMKKEYSVEEYLIELNTEGSFINMNQDRYGLLAMLPMRVQVNSPGDNKHGVTLGFLHTGRWADRGGITNRVTGEKVSKDDMKEALRRVMKIRQDVLTAHGKGELISTTIKGRKSNIKRELADEGNGSFFTGIAIKGISPVESSETLGRDPSLNYSFVKDEGEVARTAGEDLAEKEIAVSPSLKKGTPVVLLPLEDSGILAARKIVAKRVDSIIIEKLVEMITRLHKKSTNSLVYGLIGQGTKGDGNNAPTAIKDMFSSVVFTGYRVGMGSHSNFMKFNIEAKDANSTDKGSQGSLTFTISLGNTFVKIAYTQTFQNKRWTYNEPTIEINGKQDTDVGVIKQLAVTSKESLPFYHIEADKLASSQKRGYETPVLRLTEGGNGQLELTYTKGDYIKLGILGRTMTNVGMPNTTVSREKSYTTNTIITIDTNYGTPVSIEGKAVEKVNDKSVDDNIEKGKELTGKALEIATIQKEIEDWEVYSANMTEFTEALGLTLKTFSALTVDNLKKLVDKVENAKFKGYIESLIKTPTNLTKIQNTVNAIEGNLETLNNELRTARKPKKKGKKRRGGKKDIDTGGLLFDSTDYSKVQSDLDKKNKAADKKPDVGLSTEEDAVEEALQAIDKALDNKGKNEVAISENAEQKFFIIRKALALFNYKVNGPRLFSSEIKALSESVFVNTVSHFVGMNLQELTKEHTQDLYESVANSLVADTNTAIAMTEDYIAHLIDNEKMTLSSREVAKAMQYVMALENTLKDKKGLNSIVEVGYAKALKQLGYIKLTASIDKLAKDELNEVDGEELAEEETEAQTSWNDINYSLLKNPKDLTTARVKSLLLMSRKYVYNKYTDDVQLDTGLLGTPLPSKDMFLVLASLFSDDRSDHSITGKTRILKEKVASILSNPELGVHEYALIDVLEMLNPRSKGKVKFSKMDRANFNVAMNKNPYNARGLKAAGKDEDNQMMYEDDYNFASIYKALIREVKAVLDGAKLSDEISEFISNIIKTDYVKQDISSTSDLIIELNRFVGSTPTSEKTAPNRIEDSKVGLSELLGYVSTLHEFIDNLRQQSYDTAVTDFRKGAAKKYRVNGVVDPDIVEKVMHDALADTYSEIALKLGALLRELKIPIEANFNVMVRTALLNRQSVALVDETGSVSGGHKSFATLTSTAVVSIGRYVSSNKAKYEKVNRSIKGLLNWIVSSAGTSVKSAVQRMKSKMVGSFNDPIHMLDAFGKLRSPNFRREMKNFLMTKHNTVLKFLDNESKNPSWLSTIFGEPKRAGLLPSDISNIDKPDSALAHAYYTFGNYLRSIGMNDGIGNQRDTVSVTIENPNGTNYTHEIKARKGQFTTLTMSESDSPFGVDSLDLRALQEENGKNQFDEATLRYLVDTMIVPEINRMLQMGDMGSDTIINEDGTTQTGGSIADFNGNMIYAFPDMNTPELFAAITTLREGKLLGEISTLYGKPNGSLSSDVEVALEVIEDLANKVLKDTLTQSTEEYINHLLHIGVVRKKGDNYVLNDKFSNITAFKSMLLSEADVAKTERRKINKKAGVERETTEEVSRKEVESFIHAMGEAVEFLYPTKPDVQPSIKLDVFLSGLTKIFTPKAIAYAVEKARAEGAIAIEDKAGDLITANTVKFFQDVLLELGLPMFPVKQIDTMRREYADNPELDTASIESIATKLKGLKNTVGNGIQTLQQRGSTPLIDMHTNLTQAYEYNKNKIEGVEYTENLNMDKLRRFIMNKEAGQMFMNSNMMFLIHGDPAAYFKEHPTTKAINKQRVANGENVLTAGDPNYDYKSAIFKSMLNLGKRLGKEVSPGVFSDGTDKLIYISIQDIKRISTHYNAESENAGSYTDVRQMEVMDGGTYVSSKSHLRYLVSEGAIDESEVALVQDYWDGKKSAEQLESVRAGLSIAGTASTHKPRFVGHRIITLANGMQVRLPVYIKVAETVLTTKLAGPKGSFLYALKHLVEKTEAEANSRGKGFTQVRVSPHSGIKVGAVANGGLDLEDAPIKTDGTFAISSSDVRGASLELSMDDYARQLRTDYKKGKKVKNSGQMENLIWNAIKPDFKAVVDFFGSEEVNLRDSYVNVLERLARLGKVEVAKKLTDVSSDELAKMSNKELMNLLTTELSDPKLREVIISALRTQFDIDPSLENPNIIKELELEGTKFKHIIAESSHIMLYMDSIRKLIEKRTVQKKRQGAQLPLKPDEGYNLHHAGEDRDGIILLGDTEIEPDGSFRPQLVTEKGKAPKGAQVLVPREQQLADGSYIDIAKFTFKNKKGKWVVNTGQTNKVPSLPKEVFDLIGFRTPTQDYNMMAYIQIAGFLPVGDNSSVVAPKEFIALMGSDFDIDKLFSYKPYMLKKQVWKKNDKGIRVLDKGKFTYEMVQEKHLKEDEFKGIADLEFMVLQNKRQAILKAILSDKEIILDQVVKTLNGEDSLMDFGEQNYEIMMSGSTNPDIGSLSYLSGAYNEIKRNNAITASVSLAVFAKLARVSAMLKWNPMPVFTKIGTQLQESSIQFGDKIITHLGSREKFFGVTDSKYDGKTFKEKTFDSVTDSISALISASVDNENLQIVHMLGLGDSTYKLVSGLLLSGFRHKTALAIASMGVTAKQRDKAISAYNKGRKADTKITYAGSKQSETQKLIVKDSSDFSGVTEGMQEMELVASVMELHRKLKGGGTMTDQDNINIVALHSLTTQVSKAYTNSISKVGWAFNMDSKGLTREIKEILNNKNLISSPLYAPVFAILDKIPEIKMQIDAFTIFSDKATNILTRSPLIKGILERLDSIDLEVSLHSVMTTARSYKYRNSKPNTISLVERLQTVLNARSPEIVDIRQSNPFLSRLTIHKKKIAFNKEEGTSPVDITEGLEEMADMEDILGIDMAELHFDLVMYGLTNRFDSMVADFSPYIDPKYKTLIEEELTDGVDSGKIAAFLVYDKRKSLTEYPGEEAIIADTGKTLGTIFRSTKYIDDKPVVSILYYDDSGELQFFDNADFDLFNKESTAAAVEPMFRTENRTIPKRGETVAYLSTLERVLFKKSERGIKNLLKMVFPAKRVTVTATDSVNNFLGDRMNLQTMSVTSKDGISKVKLKMAKVRSSLVHESMHAILMEIIEDYLDGTLDQSYPGMTEEEKDMANEITRVLDSLEQARVDGIKGYIAAMDASVANANKTENSTEDEIDSDIGTMAIIEALFGNIKGRLHSNVLTSEQKNYVGNLTDEAEKASAKAGLIKMSNLIARGAYVIKDGMLFVPNSAITDSTKQETRLERNINSDTITDDEIDSYFTEVYFVGEGVDLLIDKAASKLRNGKSMMNIITRATTTTETSNIDQFNAKFSRLTSIAYGLTHLDEFTSQAFAFGVGRGQDVSLGSLSNYSGVVAGGINKSMAKVLNRAFDLLMKLIQVISGKKNKNLILQDVMYATALVNNSKFVMNSNKRTSKTTHMYTEQAEELIKSCK